MSLSFHRVFPTVLAALALSACNSSEGAPPPADAACDPADSSAPPADALDPQDPKPTIVLVHGAFADASSWSRVIERLEQRGYPVVAPPNPLRGPDPDAAALTSVLRTIDGPIVLAAHSYGGIVISQAAEGNPAVKALVYIAAFAPDTGESAGAILGRFPGTPFGPDSLRTVPYALPGDAGMGSDTYIKTEAFQNVFAADLPVATALTMAVSQRPIEGSAIGATFTGTPAWRTIPSWALVSRSDHAISPDAERFMATRANAHVVEVDASHAVALSQPDAVTDIILDAAHSVH